jgi:hypothetical protein
MAVEISTAFNIQNKKRTVGWIARGPLIIF